MSEIVSLFQSLGAGVGPLGATTQPLAAVLPVDARAPATSPWTPKREPIAAPIVPDPAAERANEDARAAAIVAGRADGERETAELRAKLIALLATIERERSAVAAAQAEAIADAATTVIDAWVGGVDRRIVFAPIVRGWIARAAGAPATARVHPDDITALTAAIGDAAAAAISIAADPALARGDLCIRNAALDATHLWRERLHELRGAIVDALEEPA